jgi:hypothetical protein
LRESLLLSGDFFEGFDHNFHSNSHPTGKTYFFKEGGYWQFDDMRMRVAHQRRKPSAYRWMGCKQKHERLDEDSDERRQYWKNPRRDEEVTDVENDEDLYSSEDIDIVVSSSAPSASILTLHSVKGLLVTSLGALLNLMGARRGMRMT